MTLCYVGKATKIFFFLVALLALAGLVVGFGLLRRGGANKAHGGGPPSTTFPDPLPANATATAPASSAKPEPLSPPSAISAASPIVSQPPPPGAPAVGSPPPLPPAVSATNPASPPAFLVPPAPVSNAVSPEGP
ncbi:lysine-rich arabinogalactan protein 19 [Dendrobium catenatum]|uniref:lysine-rich arabinogalactan protein 19 n=1 Tax=Dendrobium catenatum TaxID=906689 RepID=UPI0009F4D8D4|nr:lysine-rich arabinogalactan protein 19 [Dendrobium catenatum]